MVTVTQLPLSPLLLVIAPPRLPWYRCHHGNAGVPRFQSFESVFFSHGKV